MKSVIIGASAGLGRALAEGLAEKGHALFLVSTREDDLAPVATDLSIRYSVPVHFMAADIASTDAEALRARACQALGGIDNLFVIAGFSVLDQDKGPIAPDLLRRLIDVNLTGAVQVANVFLPDLARSPHGNLVGAGSVASVRGRRSNMVYAAAKRGLESWFESARHWLAGQGGARVQFYRLGFLKTRMTFGQKLPFPAMTPEDAARRIIANLDKDLGTAYLPRWWWAIMTAIAWCPWPVFRKLDI